MKHLTPLEYDRTREKAFKLLSRQIGEKPSRDAYKREYGRLWSVLDVFALVIFFGALAISSAHIISLMFTESDTSFAQTQAGIRISKEVYVLLHQFGMILIAESSAILFLVMYRLKKNLLFLGMSIAAAIFVFYANLSSGLTVGLAILPPVFTLGIGFRLEEMITEIIRRRQEVDAKYSKALDAWELASQSPEDHPKFEGCLRAEVYALLERKNGFEGHTPGEKRQIADDEITYHDWTSGAVAQEDTGRDIPFGRTLKVVPGATTPTPNGKKPTESDENPELKDYLL